MIRPRPRRAARGALVTILAVGLSTVLTLGLGVGLALLGPTTAYAVEPESSVQISIASLAPAVPDAGDTVVITGTVKNTSKVALSKLQALMWRNQAPITDDEQMSVAVGSPADEPIGSRIDALGTWQQLTRSNDPTTVNLPAALPAGESTTFTVRASMPQFEFPGTPGVYLIGVQMRGTTDGLDGADVTLGRARTFLPVGMTRADIPRPVPVCSVIVLSTAPTLLSAASTSGTSSTPARFLDDTLAAKVADGGELDQLLDLVTQPGYSVLVDPALVASVRELTKAHQVRQPDGSYADRPAATAATAAQGWLSRLGQVPRNRLYQLPYANPDLAALAHSGQQALYRPDLGADILPGIPRIALPAGGEADDETLRLAGSGNVAAVLLARDATGRTAPVLSTAVLPVPIITFDQTALDGGPVPDPKTTPAQIRQRYLADTLISATGSAPAAVVRLITTARQASAVPSVQAPWLAAVPLANLLDDEPQLWLGSPSYPASAHKAELSRATVTAAENLARDYVTFAELQGDPERTDSSAAVAVARATSVHWRGNADLARTYLAPQRDELDQVLDGGIRIDRLNKVLLTNESGETGFSIVNDTDVDVRVSVRFTSNNPQRLTVENIIDEAVPARSRAPVTAKFAAQANGEVPVTAQLTTVNGTPIGKRVDFIVSATQYGLVGVLIAVAAAVVLLFSTFLRIRQVRREAAAATAETGPDGLVDGMIDTRGPQPEPPTTPHAGS